MRERALIFNICEIQKYRILKFLELKYACRIEMLLKPYRDKLHHFDVYANGNLLLTISTFVRAIRGIRAMKIQLKYRR